MQNLQVMAEETVRDRFISQLNDIVIQHLLEEKVIDNPSLSVLATNDYALCWANPSPK